MNSISLLVQGFSNQVFSRYFSEAGNLNPNSFLECKNGKTVPAKTNFKYRNAKGEMVTEGVRLPDKVLEKAFNNLNQTLSRIDLSPSSPEIVKKLFTAAIISYFERLYRKVENSWWFSEEDLKEF